MTDDVTHPELAADQARDLTDRIKTTADQLWRLLQQAHEGKAWKSLGYNTWSDYVGAEFGISRPRSYELLNQAKVMAAISAAPVVSDASDIKLTTREVRSIAGHESELQEHLTGTTRRDGEDARTFVARVISELRSALTRTEPAVSGAALIKADNALLEDVIKSFRHPEPEGTYNLQAGEARVNALQTISTRPLGDLDLHDPEVVDALKEQAELAHTARNLAAAEVARCEIRLSELITKISEAIT